MKKFLVVEHQAGEGCDYSIGCGVLTYEVEAESMDAVLAQLKSAAFSEGESSDEEGGGLLATQERKRGVACVYEIVAAKPLPLAEWRKELRAAGEKEAQEAKERDERETLAKLQKKYGAKA